MYYKFCLPPFVILGIDYFFAHAFLFFYRWVFRMCLVSVITKLGFVIWFSFQGFTFGPFRVVALLRLRGFEHWG